MTNSTVLSNVQNNIRYSKVINLVGYERFQNLTVRELTAILKEIK